MDITYLFDPMCSWCWGFSPVINKLSTSLEGRGQLNYRVGGLRAGQCQPLTPPLKQYILDHWQHVAQATGQPFNFAGALPEGFVYDTEPACRAVVAARQQFPDQLKILVEALQRSFYVDQLDITTPHGIKQAAIKAQLPVDRFMDAFFADEIKELTQQDFDLAYNLGIQGFPTLLYFDQQQWHILVNGYMGWDQLQPLVEELFS
ncbi:DsbA family protein [Endozoicomonas sp. SM1973]|uniref:DsbA family protein n=1 Tax=Spartinivicinus marinus TaxID=2994442 RepID=A0A853IA98_9GAMM|nr:DsbA family protein [Spartinivicinus marinus]MCX4028765.1 DsbA family protein [Spartinivicinus marinus]NYZ67578.1 DsbA family protein [Spartinivicinus marinus]